jgi:hypothetical protein
LLAANALLAIDLFLDGGFDEKATSLQVLQYACFSQFCRETTQGFFEWFSASDFNAEIATHQWLLQGTRKWIELNSNGVFQDCDP